MDKNKILHDLKNIALDMQALITAIDKLHNDITQELESESVTHSVGHIYDNSKTFTYSKDAI